VSEFLGQSIVDERLAELDFGEWEGMRWDDVPRSGLDAWAADPWYFRPGGGESAAVMVSRVRAFWDDRMAEGRSCRIVTHGGPLRVLPALAEGRPVDILSAAPGVGWAACFRIRPPP